MLDEYLWGEVDRVSPEAPVPVVHVKRESRVLGGAGNHRNHVVGVAGSNACDRGSVESLTRRIQCLIRRPARRSG